MKKADELIEFCRGISNSQPDGLFPSEGWLRKRGRFKDRPGEVYNTASIYIKTWIGGIRKLRQILDQSGASTTKWTPALALAEYKRWYEKYGFTAEQARSRSRAKKSILSVPEIRRATNLCAAVTKYCGGTKVANKKLGIVISKTRYWTKDRVLEIYLDFWQRFQLIPEQVNYLSKKGLLPELPKRDRQISSPIIEPTKNLFGNPQVIYDALMYQPFQTKEWLRKNKKTLPERKKRTSKKK